MGNPAVAVAGRLKTDGLNFASKVSLSLHPVRALRLLPVVETAPGQFHQSMPPADRPDDVFERGRGYNQARPQSVKNYRPPAPEAILAMAPT